MRNKIILLALVVGGIVFLIYKWFSHQSEIEKNLNISDTSFSCIRDMTKVRGMYVDNLVGDIASTVAVANSRTGGEYPPGSVVQLVPTEVMVKHPRGFNPATKDWEFFELEVSKGGSTIKKRGFVDVVNRFNGNCFDCHIKAKPEWDLICETGHGCDPLPLTKEMLSAIQKTDPRCATNETLTKEEIAAIGQLQNIIKGFMAQKKSTIKD